jgi:4-amino-4-deoxy-L-arabinose transferase-like glycosyltransferase
MGAVALGLATLAKDSLGTIGPLAALALAVALSGRLLPIRAWLSRAVLVGLVLVPLAWFAVVAAASPGAIGYSVVDHAVRGALAIRRFPDEDVPLGSLEFLAVALLGALPWSIAAAGAIVDLVRRRAWRDPAEAPWVALALWALGVIGVFALLPFKLPHYGLPAYGAIALLAARWWQRRPRAARGAAAAHLALFAALAAALGWVALSDGRAFLATVVGAADITARKETAAGALPAWTDLEPLVATTAAIFAVGAVGLAAAAVVRRGRRLALAAVAATALACVPAVSVGLATVAIWRSVAPLAAELRAWPANTRVIHEGPLEYSAALELYSGRRPVILDGTRSVLGFGATFPEARHRFWTREQLARELADGRPAVLISARGTRGILGGLPAGCRASTVEARGVRTLAVLRC